MSTEQGKNSVKEDIRREFQLERMILFSDAVFAIVITLMAIEIHVPEPGSYHSSEELIGLLVHLLPNVIAYAASFFFIGLTWYQHLQIFSLLKDYDKGLIVRNLIMLFFIGFFPFSAALVARPAHGVFITILIYFSIIFLSRTAQLVLHHYILMKRPNLRNNADIHSEVVRYKRSRLAIIMLVIMFVLTCITMSVIKDPEIQPYSWWWFFLFPVLLKYFQKRIK